MKQTMCTKEYYSEMRGDCKCKKCLLELKIDRVEKKLSELGDKFNKASQAYSNYLAKIREEVGDKIERYSYQGKRLNSNYDTIAKRLWLEYKVIDDQYQRQVYRLTSLERQLESLEEDEAFDWDNPKYKRLLEILTK